MKTAKKILAVALACIMVMLTMAVPAFATTESNSEAENAFYMVVDKLLTAVLKVLNFFIPGINWTNKWPTTDNYESPDGFYSGEESFNYEVSDDAVWSVGYSYASLLEGLEIFDGTYYMAGTLEVISGRVPTELYDDQGVTVYAISDGVSGTVVHAVIDGYGIARGDVLAIRNLLADFAAENGIIAINVSVLHQHSCIDILGMGAPLLPALLANPTLTTLGLFDSVIGGKNTTFMNNMYNVVAQAIKDAVADMTEGSLYYGYINAKDYIHDKREPIVFDENLTRLRFVPDDATENEIWLVEAGIHCVGLGAGPDIITADFPYYLKDYINDQTGADVVYIQGAELALTTDYTLIKTEESGKSKERIKAYGEALGDLVISIDNDVELDPVLNIAITEVRVDADNQVLTLAVREGLLNSVVEKDCLGYNVVSEVGYMELGNDYTVGIVMAPGEIAPEIIWGGATTAEDSWLGTSWDYAPLADIAGADTVICYGLINDQIGYILCDNDYRSMFTENEEINAVSPNSGSAVATAFNELITAVK